MDELAASFRLVQWVVLAYLVALTGFAALAGRIGDLLGRRRVLVTVTAMFVVASVLCPLAPNIAMLIAARALQGVGAAIMLALSLALVADIVPEARRGMAIGLAGSMSAVGTTLGPSLGGMRIAAFGWQAIFLINVPLGLLSIVLAYHFVPAAVACDTARAKAPGMLALCHEPGVMASLIMAALVATVMMATLIVGPVYLSRTMGLSVQSVGLVLSVGPLVAALAGWPAWPQGACG